MDLFSHGSREGTFALDDQYSRTARTEFMTETRILLDWKPEHPRLWSRVPLRLRHRLDEHPLFEMVTLARLIETYPRRHYQLMQPAAPPDGVSRDGDLGDRMRTLYPSFRPDPSGPDGVAELPIAALPIADPQ